MSETLDPALLAERKATAKVRERVLADPRHNLAMEYSEGTDVVDLMPADTLARLYHELRKEVTARRKADPGLGEAALREAIRRDRPDIAAMVGRGGTRLYGQVTADGFMVGDINEHEAILKSLFIAKQVEDGKLTREEFKMVWQKLTMPTFLRGKKDTDTNLQDISKLTPDGSVPVIPGVTDAAGNLLSEVAASLPSSSGSGSSAGAEEAAPTSLATATAAPGNAPSPVVDAKAVSERALSAAGSDGVIAFDNKGATSDRPAHYGGQFGTGGSAAAGGGGVSRAYTREVSRRTQAAARNAAALNKRRGRGTGKVRGKKTRTDLLRARRDARYKMLGEALANTKGTRGPVVVPEGDDPALGPEGVIVFGEDEGEAPDGGCGEDASETK